jgi:hypothetical protein
MDATATTALRELQEERAAAAARIGDLERQWRDANQDAVQASGRLTAAERAGASPNTIRKIEAELGTAKAKAAEPWSERIAGAQAASRDVERRLRQFTADNLGELVTAIEVDGELAAQRLNAAAADLLAAAAEWRSAEARIGQTIALVHRPTPHDVSRSRSEEVVRAVAALVAAGGEEGAKLDRSRDPWSHILGAPEPELEESGVAA